MISLRGYRARIIVGLLLLVLGMFITAAATHPTPTGLYYEENGTLVFRGGEILRLPANTSALYPYEYKSEYSLKVTLWGTGEVELKNTYTGERLNVSLTQNGVPVTLIPPATVELSSPNAQILRYSLEIYSSSSVSSELWLIIIAMFLTLIGAVLGISGVMELITKKLGKPLVKK